MTHVSWHMTHSLSRGICSREGVMSHVTWLIPCSSVSSPICHDSEQRITNTHTHTRTHTHTHTHTLEQVMGHHASNWEGNESQRMSHDTYDCHTPQCTATNCNTSKQGKTHDTSKTIHTFSPVNLQFSRAHIWCSTHTHRTIFPPFSTNTHTIFFSFFFNDFADMMQLALINIDIERGFGKQANTIWFLATHTFCPWNVQCSRRYHAAFLGRCLLDPAPAFLFLFFIYIFTYDVFLHVMYMFIYEFSACCFCIHMYDAACPVMYLLAPALPPPFSFFWCANSDTTHFNMWLMYAYGVATISRLHKIVGLFCRILSLLQGCFAKETCVFKEPTNRSHPIYVSCESYIQIWKW